MATSVAPESREAAVDPGAAAREASAAPVVVPASPTERPVQRNDETGDAFKERVRLDARDRALAIAKDAGMPGVGAPELSDAEKAAKVLDINARSADPVTALLADAAAGPAAVVDPAVPAAPVVDPAAPVVPVAEPATEPAPAGIPVELSIPGQADPFVLEVGDQDTADIITDLQRRAAKGDRADVIRQDATRLRDESDDFRFVVDLDPAGVMQESVTHPADQLHLAKYLLSRPGILTAELREWIAEAVEDTPERAKERGELMELERLKRRDAVKDQVAARREGRQHTREIAGTIHQSIESIVPETFSNEGRELLYNIVIDAVDGARRRSPGGRFDSRTIPGMVQHHLKTLGIAPRGTAPAREPAPAARPSAPVVPPKPVAAPAIAVSAKTAADLRAASVARQDAATASPGRGSEVSRIPVAPAYDPAQPGDALSQKIAWARKVLVPAMSKRPVGS